MARNAVLFMMVIVTVAVVTAQRRMVAGHYAQLGEFPYMVSIRVSGEHYCGGSIISDSFVLTAAHCFQASHVYDPSPILIHYGVVNRGDQRANNMVRVQKVIVHQHYVSPPENNANDIALVQLQHKVIFSPTVYPVKLPNQGYFPGAGVLASFIGWGRIGYMQNFSMDLLKITVNLLTTKHCTSVYQKNIYYPQGQLCVGYNNDRTIACHGDSGGPLIINGYIVGIASWSKDTCEIGYPTVFTNVGTYRNWILQISGV